MKYQGLSKQQASYIPLPECQERKLYRLLARNISIGVFNPEQGFIGIRTKFGSRFLDSENHWDAPEFATAKPVEVIGELPAEIRCDKFAVEPGYGKRNEELFAWLEQQEKEHV